MSSSCPGCERCTGARHHWLAADDDDGQPVFACKHCPAEVDLLADEPEPEELYGATSVCYIDPASRRGDHTAIVMLRHELDAIYVESVERRPFAVVVPVSKKYL